MRLCAPLLMMMMVIGVAWTPLAVSGADSDNSGRLHQRLARLKPQDVPPSVSPTAFPANGASCCTDPVQCSPVVECAAGLQCCQQRPLWMGSIGGYCYDPSTSTCASCPVYNPNHPEQQVCSGLNELCCAGGCVSSNDYQCCHAYGSYASWVCPAGSTCCGFAPLFQEPSPSQMQCCAPGQTCNNGTCV